jgi:DNA-binding response OmpR family regulator
VGDGSLKSPVSLWGLKAGEPTMTFGRLAGRRILVVEDDPIIAMDLKTILEDAGAVVTGPAGDLATALRLAEQHAHDAAVLDVRLERGDTLPLATILLERRLPFLFQTSDASLITGLFSGVPILRKPFRAEHLVASLAELLAKS